MVPAGAAAGPAGPAPGAHRLPVRIVADQLAVEGRVLVVGVVHRDFGAEGIGRLVEARQSDPLAIELIPARLPLHRIAGGRSLMLDEGVDLHRQAAHLVEVLVHLEAVGAVVADAEGQPAAEDARRRLGDDADGAALRVPAEEGALRTPQDLDALKVEEGGVQALRAGHVDAVDVDAHALVPGGLVGVEGNDPPDADDQRRLAGLEGSDSQRGNGAVRKADQVPGVPVHHGRARDHRNGDRRLLQVGLALRGCDHDLLEGGPRIVRHVGGEGRAGQQPRKAGPRGGCHQVLHCRPRVRTLPPSLRGSPATPARTLPARVVRRMGGSCGPWVTLAPRFDDTSVAMTGCAPTRLKSRRKSNLARPALHPEPSRQ